MKRPVAILLAALAWPALAQITPTPSDMRYVSGPGATADAATTFTKRVLDVGRVKKLGAAQAASLLGCKLGAPEVIHAHRTEYALSGCAGVKSARVLTGGKGWVAVSLQPVLPLELVDVLPLLVDFPFHLRQETAHGRDGLRVVRGYSYLFGVPAGMIALSVVDEEGEGKRPVLDRVTAITVSNEPPAALAKAKSIRQVREGK